MRSYSDPSAACDACETPSLKWGHKTGAKENHPSLTIYSSSLDAAYDDTNGVEKNSHPIIALNSRNNGKDTISLNPKLNIDKVGNFFCSKNFRLVKN